MDLAVHPPGGGSEEPDQPKAAWAATCR